MTLRLGNYGYVPPEDGQPGKFYCKADYRKVTYETPGKSPRDKEKKEGLRCFFSLVIFKKLSCCSL